MEEVQKHTVHTLVFRSLKRAHDMFLSEHGRLPPRDPDVMKLYKSIKARDNYGHIVDIVKSSKKSNDIHHKERHENHVNEVEKMDLVPDPSGMSLVPVQTSPASSGITGTVAIPTQPQETITKAIIPRRQNTMPKPKWHAPWKLFRVISGHLGWVRCVAVEPANEWFVTGSADRVIKVWDLATGTLKVSLTGHIATVRGLAVSPRHPYLFSCGEDRQVKCWDLEYNKVIRHYHGHLSAVYCLALHPTIDVLITAGRDSTARVWDMRTKANVHTLSGHTNTIASVLCQASEPQVITGSHDCTIRLWDLAAGKSRCTLTHHKKSVRALTLHPDLYMFASASPDNIKQWRCPEGKFVQNLVGHNAILECLAVNSDGVLVSGGNNGSVNFWDWRTGYNFQRLQAPVQPGSMDSEAGVYSMTFDMSGSRLITTDADKTIKIYREDETATEESHPINWRPDILKRKRY